MPEVPVDERSERERLMEEARESPPWEPTAENVERWAVFRRRMGDMQAFVRLTAITQRLREIEEAAREVSFHDGNDTACLCPVHGGLCRRCKAFDRLRTALDADTGGRDDADGD